MLFGVFDGIILRILLIDGLRRGLHRAYMLELEALVQLNITGLRQGYASYTYTLKASFEP